MESGEATIAKNKYGSYSVPANLEFRPAVKRVSAGLVYEPKTIAFMARNAGEGDVIHAGTFFGDFLPGVSAGLGEDRKIWAFEPNPNSFENASATIELNGLKNVELRNFALSDQIGEIHFRTHDENGKPLGGHSHFSEAPGSGVTSVKAVTLDEAVPPDRQVTILQLDIEGHERKALLGARELITKWKPILILEEFHQGRWLRNTFRGLGYRRVRKLHGNVVFAVPGTDIRPLHDK